MKSNLIFPVRENRSVERLMRNLSFVPYGTTGPGVCRLAADLRFLQNLKTKFNHSRMAMKTKNENTNSPQVTASDLAPLYRVERGRASIASEGWVNNTTITKTTMTTKGTTETNVQWSTINEGRKRMNDQWSIINDEWWMINGERRSEKRDVRCEMWDVRTEPETWNFEHWTFSPSILQSI